MTFAKVLATPLDVGHITLPNRVFLAPLSGITDEPFRERALKHGAGLVVTEMVASGELSKGRAKSSRRIRRPDVKVHVVQLAGRDAHWMAEGAKIAVAEGADIIDINMGCPAKKVTGGYCGSALMRDIDHASTLIDAVVSAVDVPVTVKMRLGWDDDSLNAAALAKKAEAAGVSMITVHGRTRCQFYNGRADWNAVRDVKDVLSIPLVINGDIQTIENAEEALRLSGADAVMVGRAHYGAPWQAAALVEEVDGPSASHVPSVAGIAGYIEHHYESMLSLYGTLAGTRHARKHLNWYMQRHLNQPPSESDRETIMTSTEPKNVIERLRDVFDRNSDLPRLMQ